MDFSLDIYKELLVTLLQDKYAFQTYSDFIRKEEDKVVILRQDVDLRPYNSLVFAAIQAEKGIKGTYYFRAVPESWNDKVILSIAELGHEIGYHYEDLAIYNGNVDKAYESFCRNLERLRKLVTVETISMHGSPLSKYDNRNIWKKYDYKQHGIIGEPYFDTDYREVLYLTDTGRRWDGRSVSVRDKVEEQVNLKNNGQKYNSTKNIIQGINAGKMPQIMLFTFHPQRWTNSIPLWIMELILQKTKNTAKRLIVSNQNSRARAL